MELYAKYGETEDEVIIVDIKVVPVDGGVQTAVIFINKSRGDRLDIAYQSLSKFRVTNINCADGELIK